MNKKNVKRSIFSYVFIVAVLICLYYAFVSFRNVNNQLSYDEFMSNLNKGTYAIYIETKTNVEDYGELNDIFQREITSTMTYNDKTYSLKINENQRFRLELEVK